MHKYTENHTHAYISYVYIPTRSCSCVDVPVCIHVRRLRVCRVQSSGRSDRFDSPSRERRAPTELEPEVLKPETTTTVDAYQHEACASHKSFTRLRAYALPLKTEMELLPSSKSQTPKPASRIPRFPKPKTPQPVSCKQQKAQVRVSGFDIEELGGLGFGFAV